MIMEAINLLKENNLKITHRRKRIIELMYEQNKYLSATEVKELLIEDFPGISPDTIYRNLYLFSKLNILDRTEVKGEYVFKICCFTEEHHHHFICTSCGHTIKLLDCPINYFQDKIGDAKIKSHRFELLGLCEKCI